MGLKERAAERQETIVPHQVNSFRALFLLLLVVLAFAFQGSRGLFMPDEGYHVSIAQAMAQTNDYLIPRLHFDPWLDKPPLSLWGIAAGLKLLGQNEWGARVFHALCYLLTALIVYFLGRSLAGRRQGLLGATIYATMAIPFAAANVVTPDSPLTFWTTAAFFCFWKSVEPDGRRVAFWKMSMCAAFGLGFLTKGPAALVPSGAMFLFLVFQGRACRYFLTPWAFLGVGLFCLLGMGWYAWVVYQIPGSLDYFLDNHLVRRIVSDKYARNPGLAGAVIYLPVVLLGTLPWSFFWLGALKRSGRKVLRKATWRDLRDDPARLLLALWIAVPLAALCLASSKLPLNALPVFPALALATARLFPGSVQKSWRDNPLGFSRGAIIALGLWAVVLCGIKFAASVYPHEKDMRALHGAIQDYLPAGPFEIVSVQEHLEGLGFYRGIPFVERVETSQTPYPLFVLPEHMNEEIAELRTTAIGHLFICQKEKRARQIRYALQEAGIPFRETALPFRRYLFTVDAMKKESETVRLVALGDAGKNKGKSRGFSIGSALRRVYGESSFDDGILLLGDNFHCTPEEAGDLAAVARRQIEVPFKAIIDLGVPFYAVLGNHDNEYGLQAFELRYALFHMNGKRYYSKLFGNGLVEVFFLDSNTLADEDIDPDPRQIQWLDTSLEQSRAPWKVVCLHHPLYSSAMKYPTDPDMIRMLESVFRKRGVSLVLQGHNHVYERLAPVHGVHYVTAGSGGTVRRGDLRPNAPERLASNDQDHVLLALEFDHQACHLTAYDSLLNVVDECSIALSPNMREHLRNGVE